MVFIWLQKPGFCALVTLGREEREGPTDGPRKSCIWLVGTVAGPACELASAHQVRLVPRPVERKGTPTWCKASDSPIPPVASGGFCCCGPRQVHRLSRARQPTANGSIMLTAWEGLERPAVTPSPCSILGFDLPLAIVSKDQGTSITFKGPIEPPGDETSSRGSTLLRQKVPGLGVVFAWGTVWGSTRVWFVYWVGLAFSFF